MRNKISAIFLGIVFATCAVPAQAAFTCTGNVSSISIHVDGRLITNYGHGEHIICNLEGLTMTEGQYIVNNMPKSICQSIYTLLMTAKATGKTVSMIYDPLQGPRPNRATSCTELGSGVWPNPPAYKIYLNN